MFFKPAVFITTALVTFAAATPAIVARTEPAPSSSCGTTTVTCCQDVGTAQELEAPLKSVLGLPLIGGLVNVVASLVGGADVVLGLTCNDVSIVGGSCNAKSVCCQNVAFNGLINVGCTSIL